MPIKRNLCAVLLLCLLLLPLAGWAANTTTAGPQQTITMQQSQYNRLKEIINQQELTLETLQLKLNLLSQHSSADKQTLMQLQNELTSCRAELTQTQQSLLTAKSSLMSAESTLKKQEESLRTLTEKIAVEAHKAMVARRQRDTYAMLAGVLLIYVSIK
ncbi:hypothetical protein [Megasphaera stantonii]|uniref:hypothetical protein n=1 Tax=Megasphaera stantonii TaxID=2144175 RepID=UPI001D684D4D|nr:hypothetical protein [Megasphaera stantonii]HJE83186.1 hypothetical protein [Megasphaera stantonii]